MSRLHRYLVTWQRVFPCGRPQRSAHYLVPHRHSHRTSSRPDVDNPSSSSPSAKIITGDGTHAQTDDSIQIRYPEIERDIPSSSLLSPEGWGGGEGNRRTRTLASFSLEGRVAVVTGGARGLGLVMSSALVESGANVALVDLNYEEAAKQAHQLVDRFRRERTDDDEVDDERGRLPHVTAHHADVSSSTSVNEVIQEIVHEHGQIDHLVTSAGFTENFDAISYPLDRMRKLWSVNVDGTYLCAVAVARHLMSRRARGSMVFIGSMSGAIVNVPQPQAPYNASKAAVRHLAASLAVEWAPAGIRVNCISPGYMLTALTQEILDANPTLGQRWTSLIPQGRLGNPTDLMGAVVFLASDASRYITGADLRVDGGYTLT